MTKVQKILDRFFYKQNYKAVYGMWFFLRGNLRQLCLEISENIQCGLKMGHKFQRLTMCEVHQKIQVSLGQMVFLAFKVWINWSWTFRKYPSQFGANEYPRLQIYKNKNVILKIVFLTPLSGTFRGQNAPKSYIHPLKVETLANLDQIYTTPFYGQF